MEKIIIWTIFLGLVALLVALKLNPPFTVKSNWNHYFDDMQISSATLYPKIITRLREWKVDVSVTKKTMKETHVFSAEREYLQIDFNDYVFYFGVYEFGKGTYASWWLGIYDEGYINKIPVISQLMGKDRRYKTFYQQDTETMYRSTIHTAILSVIEEVGQQKGARALSPEHKQYSKN